MDLKGIMLREICQTEKHKYSLIGGIKQQKSKLVGKDQVYPSWSVWGGGSQEGVNELPAVREISTL